MPAKEYFIHIKYLEGDLFFLSRRTVLQFREIFIRTEQAKLLRFEDVGSVDMYLSCANVLSVLELQSAAWLPLKEPVCLEIDDNSFIILLGIERSIAYSTKLLTKTTYKPTRIVR